MRQSLELRLGQRLSMTPQLQQAIRLLQLSALELRTEIQEALESNPLLEEPEAGAEDSSPADAEAEAGEEPADAAAEPEDSPLELDDLFDATPSSGGGDEDGQLSPEARATRPETLRDHLEWQMHMTPFTQRDREIASTLIDGIDSDGYLGLALEEVRETLEAEPGMAGVELAEIEAVLHQIQNFDPPGVGARNPGECLWLQLRDVPAATPGLAAARRIAREHLDLLAQRDYAQLRRLLGLDNAGLQEAIALIQRLNPHPGAAIEPLRPDYVVADVVVRRNETGWRVDLNPEAFPRIGINHHYRALIRRGDSSADNRYLQEQLAEARWFLKSLRHRSATVLKVARAIIGRQEQFLEHGEQAMRPLVLHDIAAEVGMHESTISRVTSQKYMLTPRGIFEFKYFFSSGVATADGGTCSATAIRSLIRKLIDTEPPTEPISDSKIVEILSGQGIQVARRTIAKYRELMNIPPSGQRKSLV